MSSAPANPLERPGYALVWHDEFEGHALDTQKWLPLYLPHWSSRERASARYGLQDSTLVLRIDADQRPWCPEFDGGVKVSSIQTGLFAGSLGSALGQHRFNPRLTVREAHANVRLYTPHYGYFECRAKCVNTPGNHVALWLIGYEDAPDRCGEICMFEILGADVSATTSKVGYGIKSWADPTLSAAFYRDSLDIDATHFHIYAHEWTPTHIDFYVDNHKIRRINQSPAYPMQFMLGLYEAPGVDARSAYPKEFVVDYVRTYQPVSGY